MQNINAPGKIFIISASSGAGKTTLVNLVLERLKPTICIDKVVTYTTRNQEKAKLTVLTIIL
jgi:guanylate kinase